MKFAIQVFDFLIWRYLDKRGAKFCRSGLPEVAVFAFDHIGHEIALRGRYEAAELQVTIEFLKESSLISGAAIDVGANIGNHSLFFSEHFNRVIALEPNPRVYELLSINARLRSNILPINVGASDKGASLGLQFDRGNLGGARLSSSSEISAGDIVVTVSVVTLDDLMELKELDIGLIKIDVEGHEHRVLKGSEKLIDRFRPVILFEQHEDEILDGSSEVIDWLRAKGYKEFFEVRSIPSLPRSFTFPGRMVANALLRLITGEKKQVVAIERFEKSFYPMVIALPTARER